MFRSALLIVVFPVALAAQVTASMTPFVALDQSLSTHPILLGASLGVSMGPIGLRGSGSVAHSAWQLSDTTTAVAGQSVKAFAGDVDLVLNPGRRAGAAGTFGSLEPRVFAGIGVRGEAAAGGGTNTHTVLSVGSILSYSLFSRLRFDVEARRLVPTDAVKGLLDGSRGAWEYRAGLALHFGKGNLRPTAGVLTGWPVTGGTAARSSGRVVTPAAGTLLADADSRVGTPYVWGGTTPDGFDCSGFVQYVFNAHGVRLPRTSREMALVGQSVGKSIDALRPGDLMFFAEHGSGITHVGIYAGDNMLLHSSKSGDGVGYDDLTTARGHWYQNIYVGAQRVLGVPVQGVTLAGGARGESGRTGARLAGSGPAGAGIAEFLKAAGMVELSDVAKRLYRPGEKPDAPDGAPRRRW